MKSYVWKSISVGVGALGAIATRKLVGAVWPGASDPPVNPADRRTTWNEALMWAIASGVGAGVARLVSHRVAAAGWERATGESPPGLRTA